MQMKWPASDPERPVYSARDFGSRQNLKGADILCVFQALQTAALSQKIRRRQKTGACLRMSRSGIVFAVVFL